MGYYTPGMDNDGGGGGGGGTVTSVTVGDGLDITPDPLTTTGVVDLDLAADSGLSKTGGDGDQLTIDVLVYDAQHGVRGGGTQHAVVVPAGAAGFMSGADKTKLDGLPASAVPTTRTITAGAGLTGGGDLSADRTIDAVANADGSITVNPNDIQVGILATDAQHGVRGGGTQHAVVVPAGAAGFMTGADKTKLDGIATGGGLVQTQSIKLAADVTTVNTTTGDVLLTQAITVTLGTKLIVNFTISGGATSGNRRVTAWWTLDGVDQIGGSSNIATANGTQVIAVSDRVTVAAGVRTVVVRWKVSSGTGEINAATTPLGYHASLVVEEVSV